MGKIALLLKHTGDPKKLWRRYVGAMPVILALLATTHVSPTLALQAGSKKASFINDGARQIMLSQRILFLSSQMAQDHDPLLEQQLRGAIDFFATSHDTLISSPKLSTELEAIYGVVLAYMHAFVSTSPLLVGSCTRSKTEG